ncbi:MAG: EAL domain-containing protein [Chromatocurvus sp.]
MDYREFLNDAPDENTLQAARYHQLMLDLSMSFINLPMERVTQATREALARMASFFGADRAYVFEYNFARDSATNTHECCAEGITPVIANLQDVPIGELSEWSGPHKQGKPLLVPDVDQLPASPLRDMLESQGIRSLLTAPLMDGDSCIGFVGFDSVRDERQFTEGEYDLLVLFANLLVSIDQRKKTVDKLTQAQEHLALANERLVGILDSTRAAERALEQRTEELTRANLELEQLATVFTHANEGICITDPEGTIIQVNAAMCSMSGYSRDELIGENPRLLRSGLHPEGFYRQLWGRLTESGHWRGEVWHRKKDGELFATNLTISRVRDNGGNLLHYVALATDITDRMQHQAQLERTAHYDAVTQLPNRVLLAREMKQAMAHASRHESRIAIAYLDLDGFKGINDQHGHGVGDQLLATIALNMKASLRAEDTLARLGGDEFVAVFTGVDNDQALNTALKRLLQAAAAPIHVDGYALQVSASLGVTLYPQSEFQDADQLLRQADQAMYQAKLSGKDRYTMFDTQRHQAIVGHHERIDQIEKALKCDEFVLYYQPKVNMRTGEVIGLEALVRWQHPERGILLPSAFLPVIHKHPLSTALDAWVLGEALAQRQCWQRDHAISLAVSINLGPMTLQQGQFVDMLRGGLARWPVTAESLLEIEILESSALDDIDAVIDMIRACRELGVRFALDDFGVGYSSLTYLKRLPADILKIDQSFVRDMLHDVDDLAILKGILGLSRVFERDVIAEGVETIRHGERLLDLGCECAQGYGIARPMPAEQVIPWLETWMAPGPWLNRPQTIS